MIIKTDICVNSISHFIDDKYINSLPSRIIGHRFLIHFINFLLYELIGVLVSFYVLNNLPRNIIACSFFYAFQSR